MAESDVLKEFVVSLKWNVDQSSLQRVQEALKNGEAQVKRFADQTHRGETLWARFFQQFRRSEGAQREHIDITNRLSKAYESFGINLKQIATLASGGAITAAFVSLTKEFNNLWYSALQAGTSVEKLLAIQFGASRVGVGAQEITADLVNLRRAFDGIPGPGIAQMFQGLGLDVIDPLTGKVRDMDKALIRVLQTLGEKYSSGPAGPGIVQEILGTAGVAMTPALEQLLKFPELIDQMVKGAGRFDELAERIGGGAVLKKFAGQSRDLENQWNELLTTFQLLKVELAGPWQKPAEDALKSIEDWIWKVNDSIKKIKDNLVAAFSQESWEGVGKNVADGLMSGLSKLFDQGMPGWELTGEKAADDFIKGFFTELWKSWRTRFDMFMDAVRSGLMNIPGIRDLPGVAPGENELPQPTPETQRRYAPLPPKMQSGGVVPILAHAGEVVLGADLVRMMMDWLRGGGGFRPLVHVDNPEDFTKSFGEVVPGEGERGPGFGRPRHGDPFGLSGRRSSAPGLGDPKTALSAIEKFESSGRNVLNGFADAMHTASGFFQITNSTWRGIARKYGVDTSHYARAMDAPRELQEQAAAELYKHEGFGPWAPYNDKLRSFLRSHPGFPGDSAPILGQGVAPLGATNNYRAGDRTVTINAAHNFNITGTDALSIGGAINSVTERQNADLIRNLTPVVQ